MRFYLNIKHIVLAAKLSDGFTLGVWGFLLTLT